MSGWMDKKKPTMEQSKSTHRTVETSKDRLNVDEDGFIAPKTSSAPGPSPAFGQPSQLRSPLKPNNAFNIPKPNRPRPEHHRMKEETYKYSNSSGDDSFMDPVELMNRKLQAQAMPVPIRPPIGAHIKAIHRPPPQLFSSMQTSFSTFAKEDSLKKDLQLQGLSQADAALFEDKYGNYDGAFPADPAKAARDVKALLEGAFDDDEDKPQTRAERKKIAQDVDELADKLQNVKVGEASDANLKGAAAVEDEEVEGDFDDGTRDGLKVNLLPHQIAGVDWMYRQEVGTKSKKTVTKGGILADDMGLGKTIQTIALLLRNPRPKSKDSKLSPGVAKTTLVVAPLALIKQWERELEEKIEDSHFMKVLVHHGPKRTKRGDDLRKYDVVVTTYQTITSEHEASSPKDDGPKVGCFDVQWYRVILDEAHTIKNHNAKCTKGCYDLRAEYRWCLTGTPMQNSLNELHSLLVFLRVKSFSSKTVWKEKIVDPMNKGKAELAIKRLQAILKSILKRRTKDVLRKEGGMGSGSSNTQGFKLVGRKIEVVKASFNDKEKDFYHQLQAKADVNLNRMMSGQVNFASALALLLRLRQACNHKELIKKSLSSDPDSLELIGKTTRVKSPVKSSSASSQTVDDLAALLGGLEVNNKTCELCGDELSREETSSDMIRCVDCAAFIEEDGNDRDQVSVPNKYKKHGKSEKHLHDKTITDRQHHRSRKNVVRDSDDEETEGEWIVPEGHRPATIASQLGGSDDEDAEGGGEWLRSEDSDTDDESSTKIVNQKREAVSLTTTDDSGSETSEDSEEDYPNRLGISTKIQSMLDIVRKEVSDHKFIVFSEWTSMLNLIEPFLRREGIRYCRYDGKMKNDDRERSLDQLRNDKKTRILLCSLKCGSLGLNLTAASRVIIMEPFWNPFVEEQAIDRVHRLNQSVDVVVYRLTIEATVEERIFELQNQKRQLADAALEGKAIAKLSMNELLNLFKHDAEQYIKGTKLGDFMLGRATDPVVSRSGSSTPSIPDTSVRARIQERRNPSSRPEHEIYGRRW